MSEASAVIPAKAGIKENELPDNWVMTTLGKVTKPIEKVKPVDEPQKEILYLDIGGIDKATNTVVDYKKYLGKDAPSRAQQAIIKGDIAFANVRPYLKNIAIVPNDLDGQVGSTGFCFLRPKEGVDNKYIYYWVLSNTFINDITKYQKGSSYPAVTNKQILERNIPLAPPEQQNRIVAKIEELFSHIDAGIVALKKAKQLLKQYRQSVLKAAVTGELTKEWREANKDKLEPASQLFERVNTERKQEFERKLAMWEGELAQWKCAGDKGKKPAKPKKPKELEPISEDEVNSLGELPEGWIWARLGNLTVDVFDGPFGSNLKSGDYVEEGVRVIRLENIGNLEFKDEKESFIASEKYELLKKHTVSNGDLIFSSFVADGTRVVVLPKQIEKAINKADCFCVRCYGNSIYNYYLSLFLATNTAYKRLENQVHGATRPRINTTQLKNIEIPICSIEEQKEAARILELKFDAIDRLENEIDEKILMVDKNKQSILASAFKGKMGG